MSQNEMCTDGLKTRVTDNVTDTDTDIHLLKIVTDVSVSRVSKGVRMDDDNLIVPVQPSALAVPVTGNEEWGEIINRLVKEMSEQDLPDKVIEATEMMLAGYPLYKVADKLEVSPKTIRRWLTVYPTMAAVVASGKKLLTKWRMTKLEQQFFSALERSQEVLDTPMDGFGVNPKILTVVAAQARYIIGLFAGQRVDVSVTHELGDTVLKAKQDALQYLSEQLEGQRGNSEFEPVEAVYRVIDGKMDDSGPVLDENGNPPFGAMGVFDVTDQGALCHICGKRLKSLARHILNAHNATVENYETLYMLEVGVVRKAEGN